MIDPTQMTRYGLNRHQLEETVLFSILAVQNDAIVAAKGLEGILKHLRKVLKRDRRTGPFSLLRKWFLWHDTEELRVVMKQFGIGKHGMKSRAFNEIAYWELDLKTCTLEELEEIHGIGRKTSRFFVLHTRKNAHCAALDTHILSYMQDHGYDVPDTTPSSKGRYKEVERQFLKLAEASGQTTADFDLMIWNQYSKNGAK